MQRRIRPTAGDKPLIGGRSREVVCLMLAINRGAASAAVMSHRSSRRSGQSHRVFFSFFRLNEQMRLGLHRLKIRVPAVPARDGR